MAYGIDGQFYALREVRDAVPFLRRDQRKRGILLRMMRKRLARVTLEAVKHAQGAQREFNSRGAMGEIEMKSERLSTAGKRHLNIMQMSPLIAQYLNH
ncbi:MAG: hypothetical protein ACRD3S_01825 [Terracidiphilus sp.]